MAKNIAAMSRILSASALWRLRSCVGNFMQSGPRWMFVALVLATLAATREGRAQEAAKELPKIQSSRAINPVYPFEALVAGQGGWAEINFTVDHSGRAILPSVEKASDPAFARALQADIDAIEFIPPRRNGQPQMALTRERFDFLANPALDPIAKEILTELRKPRPAIVSEKELDSKLEAIRQPPPAYPWIMRSDGMSGEAVIEFIVDRNGRPLFPRIVSASHEDFGWSAATGILRWKYKSPMKGGAKVDARVTATVVFDINKSADMW